MSARDFAMEHKNVDLKVSNRFLQFIFVFEDTSYVPLNTLKVSFDLENLFVESVSQLLSMQVPRR